jgi:hypothetical protein
MTTREISFEEIDAENEMFRISEELDPPAMLDSLREIGQLNPVVLLEQGARKIVVCGFRRLRAMRKLGKPQILARILPGDCEPVRAYKMALWDNISQRELNPLEKARVLFGLRSRVGVPDDSIIRNYMPLLALSPAENILRSFLLLHGTQPELRKCFAEGHLTHGSLEVIATMPEAAQARIAFLMRTIRLSASSQKKFLGLLEDLADSADAQPDALLDGPEILDIANDSRLSPFQRGEKIYEVLHRRRNPRLSQATDRFLAQLRGFRFPGSIRIRAHPFFEEPGLHVEFDASNPECFRDLAAMLEQAAESAEFKNLFIVK